MFGGGPFGSGAPPESECISDAVASCKPNYDKAVTICNNIGYAAVYRTVVPLFGGGYVHNETMVPNKTDKIEGTPFLFASSPQPGADQTSIRRCQTKYTYDDFLSHSSTCEGQFKLNTLGYSLAPTTVGAKPVYRCASGKDHFISRDSKCEGKIVESLIGYAK